MSRLFVISAPSGTGKTTVIKRLLADMPELKLSVSATTRKSRAGEKDGVDYFFVSENRFKEMIESKELLEWALVHGSYYGTPKAPIEKAISADQNIILDIDVQGGMSVKKIFPGAILIFLLPPSREELIRRITTRGANSGDDLKRRIANADKELASQDYYDHRVVNDQLESAVSEVKRIIGEDA